MLFGTIISVFKSDGVVEGGTGSVKRRMQNEKILITGANSYIGTSFKKWMTQFQDSIKSTH